MRGRKCLVNENMAVMTNVRSRWTGPPEFEDLRTWVDEPTLVRHLFETLDTVAHNSGADPSEDSLPVGGPRILLTILTYAYAVNLFASDDIERLIAVDPRLRYLTARTFPTAQQLRRFRRDRRVLLERSLGGLIHRAWESRFSKDLDRQAADADMDAQLTRAAQQRIDHAVLIDSMALDI